jgi:hypothetical protein
MALPASTPERAAPPCRTAAALLALVAVLVYLPALRGGFIWDDDRLLTGNSAVKTIDGLWAVWFGGWSPDYVPLTLSSFWLEWHLWGLCAPGYHIVNVLLHAANVLLVWRILLRLRVPGAWLAALLFAVHPLCVSSVAWISERKNTLSMLFYLLSLREFLRFDDAVHSPDGNGKSTRLLCFSLAAFFLALLAKSSVAVLPAVLLLFVWWRRGRVTLRDLCRCAPFFILAVFMALVAAAKQARAVQGGVGVIHDSLCVRLLGGGRAVWFYLEKTFLPVDLTLIYPRWEMDPRAAVSWLPAVVFAGLLFILWRWRKSWGRPFLFALGYFTLALSPALGMVNLAFFSNSRVADHFQYVALPGILALVAAVARGRRRAAPALAAGMAAAVLAVLACRHERVFASERTLWEDNFEKNTNSWKVCMNLSVALLDEGRTEEAIQLKQRADTLLQSTQEKPR